MQGSNHPIPRPGTIHEVYQEDLHWRVTEEPRRVRGPNGVQESGWESIQPAHIVPFRGMTTK